MHHTFSWPIETCLTHWHRRPAGMIANGVILVVPVIGTSIRRLDWRRSDGTVPLHSPVDPENAAWTIQLARHLMDFVQKCELDASGKGGELIFHETGLWWRTNACWFILTHDVSAHEILSAASVSRAIQDIP